MRSSTSTSPAPATWGSEPRGVEMRYSVVLTSALTAAGLAGTPVRSLAAQDDSVTNQPGRLERRMDEPDRLMRIVMSRRARLGIKVNLQARDTDSLGAY